MQDLGSLQWLHAHFVTWNTYSYQYKTKPVWTPFWWLLLVLQWWDQGWSYWLIFRFSFVDTFLCFGLPQSWIILIILRPPSVTLNIHFSWILNYVCPIEPTFPSWKFWTISYLSRSLKVTEILIFVWFLQSYAYQYSNYRYIENKTISN